MSFSDWTKKRKKQDESQKDTQGSTGARATASPAAPSQGGSFADWTKQQAQSGAAPASGSYARDDKPSSFSEWTRRNKGVTAWRDEEVGFNSWLENLNSFSQRMSADYAGRDGKYQSADTLGAYRDSAYQSIDSFNSQAANYRNYFQAYKSMYDDMYGEGTVDRILSALDEGGSYLEGLRGGLGSEYDYWSQWATEKDYDDYQRRSALDIDSAKLELAELEPQLAQAEKDRNTYRGIMSGSRYMTAQQQAEYAANYQDAETRYNDLRGRVAALQEDIDGAERIAQGKQYSAYREADDFAELSRYATTANGKEAKFNAWSGMYTETGFDDITYDYINRNEEALGHQMVNDISSNASLLGVDNSFLQEMTDDEIATFNYIYATQGADQAYAYISFIANDLTYRQRAASEAEWAAYANEHPVGSSVFSVLESPLKGVSYLGQVADYAEDGKIDQNAAYNKFSYLNSAIRGEVNSIVEDKWGGVGSFAYQTGMSMGDFLFDTAITGGNSALTLGIMGTGAAADATISAKDRGLSDGQAFALGTIAGAAEIITEKVSLDALLDKTSLSRSALGYFLKNTLAEGSEEVGSDFINLFADILISKDKSEWQQSIDAYQRDGMDESEAFWHAVLDQAETMGLDFLGGAISGGVMSGGAIGINAIGSNINTRQTGAEFQAMGEDVVQATIQEGLVSDPSTQSYQLAQQLQQKLDNGETITSAELGRLYQANVQAIDAEEGAGDLLLRAAEELTQKGRVTNNMALDILGNPSAMTTLETEAGLTITENMSKAQQRKAVKSAVEALVSREGGFSAAVRKTAQANPQGAQTAAQPATQTEQRRTAQPVNIARQAHNIQGLSQAVQALGQQGAKVAADFYDGTTDTTAYYGAFSAYYQAGMTGMDMDKVRTAYTDALNDAQRQAAYLAGKNDAAASLAQEKARVQYATVYGEEAGLIQNDHTATLPKAQAVYLNNLGKALGTKIEITAAVEHGGNGAYYAADGTIRIAANAQDPAMVVASHEITHRLQDLAPEAYRKYRDYANGKIAEQVGRDAVEEIKDRYARHGVNLTTEQAMDEVAAEFTEAMVKDGKLFQDLAQDNRSVARKVLDAIRDFIRRVKSAFRGDVQAQNSAAMEQYGVDMKTLEEAARLWNKALKEASASAQSLSSVIGTEGGYAQVDGKFSLKGVVEDNGELLALHNLTEQNLRDALRLGGLPMPSIAIVQAKQGHAKYGPISLVFGTDTIDPQANSRNRVYGGDAWTPTAPTVDRVVNDRVASRLSNEIYKKAQKIADGLFLGEASSALYFENEYTSKTMDDILDDLSNNDGVRAAYLADQGKTLEPVMRDKVEQFDSFGNEALSDLAERMGAQELAAAYARTMTGEELTDGDISAVKAAIRGALEQRGGFTTNSPAKIELRLNRLTSERMAKFVQNAWDLHEAGGSSVEREVDRYATSDALRDMVDQDGLRLWLEQKLDGLLGEEGIYNGKDPFTPSGKRRGFAALHNAYTLENIVKAMTSQQAERGEGTWGASAKAVQSVSTPSYRNIREIKADSGRLGAVEGDAYKARVEAVDQQISSIIQKVKATNKAHSDNSFIESDIIGGVLMEAAKGKHTVDAIMRAFAQEDYKISSQTAQDIKTVYQTAAELPTEYFEAKPQRAVGFDEVLAAVVPNNMDAKLRAEAEQAGMRLLEYKAGDDADRLRAVNSVEGARFSIKEDSKGRTLTEQQREYFKDSKAVDDQGRLMVMYHGTRKGGFTVFRDWSYLTANQKYAERYMNRDTGETMYEVYANIKKPFDTRLEECRAIWEKEFYGEYSRTSLQESGLPDWTDGYDLVDFLEESGYDYDAILLDEGADQINGSVVERGISYVVRSSEQIKNVTNKTPTSDPDIRRSLQEKSTMRAADVKALYEENNLLRERVDYWKGQTRRTKRVTTDKKAVASAARELIRSYGADLSVDDISGDLQSLYDYIASGRDGADELTYTEARRRAEAIAARLVNSAVAVDDEMYRQYSDLRSYLRTTKLTISEADSHDIADYGDFRRRNMGRINLGKGSTNIDQVYQEMSEMWPEFFDAQREINPADQLLHIVEVLDGIYDITEYNPFSRYTEQAVTGAANEIMEQFFDLPQTRATFADRQAMKLQEAKAKGRQQLRQLREQNNAKLETLREQNRERVQRAIERERSRRDTQIGQLKERYAARDAAGRERRSAAELRRKITRHASSLSQKLLKPTDKQHIPENLRGAVAAMLESINQESQYTVDPETGKRRKGDDGLPTKRTEAFRALKEQYAKIVAEGGDLVIDPSLLGSDAEGIQGSFDAVIAMKDTRLADMTTAQLETVWKVVKAVEHSVSTAGKVLSQGKYAQTQDWAQAMEADTATRRAKRSLTKWHAMIDLETPYTFFSHYGEAGHTVYRTLRNAQDQQQLMVDRVAEEVRKIVDPKTVKNLEEATHTFTTERGEKLTLSTAQIMELYELTKRKQAQDHLLKGGIVQPEIKSAKIRRGTDAILLTAGDLETITGKLTDKQVKIADGLQKLTTGLLADYGNQASMAAYGYKKFTGTDYWPIKSAKESIHSTVEKGGNNTRSIKNIGLAKSVMPHASNPLDIAGIFSTFSAHAADMTDYAAWLCTMEDLNRLYNFRFRDGEGNLNGKTVKGILDRVGGAGSQKYWNNLMEDIQNGINAPSDSPMWDIAGKTIGSFKGAAVGANLRVVIQQPTAFFRAGAVLSPADLSRGLAKGVTKGNGWAKALQYSPIAMRKDMGGFDISSPMQMSEILFDSRTRVRKLNDALSAPAGMADAVTWGRLWNACEWATAREHKELAKGSEAFYKAVNELFTEVIDQTQVVDGVLQRSNIMRSSNAVVKQATSFMGEPIMSLNLLMRSYDQVRYEQNAQKRGRAIKTMGRAATALVVTNVVNALAQSLIDAMRDDDEDKKYWDRFRSAFTGITGEEESAWDKAVAAVFNGNVGSNMNLLGQIPFVKDALSMLQGYDVSRTEMEIVADLIEAGQTAVQSAGGAGKKTRAYAAKELLAAGAKVFGIPLGNLARDVWGFARSVTVETDNIPLQYEMEKAIYNITNSGNKGRYYDILFRALVQGDMDSYQHIRSELMDQMGMDGASIDSAMRSRYNKALEDDPDFTLSQQARDLIGSRDQYAEDKEPEETFGADDLGTRAYQSYADQRAGDYREMADGLDRDPVFQSMSDEEKDKVLAAAYKLADKTALADNSDGQYEIDTKWMALADDAEAMGIEPWEYVLFHVAYNMAESTKDENGKTVKGEAKSDHVREWLEDYAGFTDAQREFLWGTVYTGEW
jgi:hypothetical protein